MGQGLVEHQWAEEALLFLNRAIAIARRNPNCGFPKVAWTGKAAALIQLGRLAEARARAYWAKYATRFGTEPRFLAVETSKVFPGEAQDLWQKLINSETTASFFSHGMKDNSYSNLQLLGIMIFDIKTEHFVGNQGYISVDTPPRGRVARFGPYIARYIGWG